MPTVTRGTVPFATNDDSSDGIDVFLDLGGNTPLVEGVSLNTLSLGQARCVEDVSLGARSHILACSKLPETYHYAACARKFVKRRRVRLAPVVSHEYYCQRGHRQLVLRLRTFLHQSPLQEGQYRDLLRF